MGKTYDIADNLVKMASSLKYDDFDAKDKVLEYAGKLIKDEFGASSVYMQKLGLIVFSTRDTAVFSGMGAGEEHLKKTVFESGAAKLVELLEDVRSAIGGGEDSGEKIIVIQARDKLTASRMVSHIRAKGFEPVVIKDTDDWKEMIDKMIP